MTKTTIDIDDLKILKHYLVDKDLKLKDFVNAAIREKLKRDKKKKISTAPAQQGRWKESTNRRVK